MKLQRVAQIDILMIASAPVKGVASVALQSFEIDLTLIENIDVVLRKILADDADDADRREKARAQGEVRSRAAEDTLGRAERRLDGIESHGTDDQNTHKYFPMIGSSSARIFFGIRARSVMIASFNAEAQPQARGADNSAAARAIVRCARATFCFSTVSTCSISTSPAW